MHKRRQFFKIVLGWLTASGLKNSRLLHAGKEPLTPLKDFGTMGLTDHAVDLNQWHLQISGRVKSPLTLTYSEILTRPSIEKEVLLNCPGFFFNRGLWKGISMQPLLEEAHVENGATHASFSGPQGQHEKTAEFLMENLKSYALSNWNVNAQAKTNDLSGTIVGHNFNSPEIQKLIDKGIDQALLQDAQ